MITAFLGKAYLGDDLLILIVSTDIIVFMAVQYTSCVTIYTKLYKICNMIVSTDNIVS